MITSVRLKNWRSHLESEVKFSAGVNTLIGINGSGKSSVMHAVSFGLFGTFPSLKARRVELDDIVMRKPKKAKTSEIELQFSVNGKNYSVKRILKSGKGTTESELREDGRLIEATPNGVTREVERILQMDYELFSKAVYAEQNGLDYFLRLGKGDRMEHIDRMLKVDRFEAVREASVSLANKIRQKKDEKLRIISDLEKEGISEKMDKITNELETLEKEKKSLVSKSEKLAKSIEELEKTNENFEEKEKILRRLESRLEGVTSGIKEIEWSLKQKKEKIKNLPLLEKLDELNKTIKFLENQLKEKTDETEEERNNLSGLNTEIRLLGDSIKNLEKLGAVCPVCESEITEEKKSGLVLKKQKESDKLRKIANQTASKLEKILEEGDSLSKELKNKELEREKIKAMSSDIKEIENLEEKKSSYNKILKEVSEAKEKLDKELSGVNISELRKSLQEKIGEERESTAKLSSLEERTEEKKEILDELKNRQNTMARYKNEVELDEKTVKVLDVFVGILKATQDQLREEFVKTVNYIMENVWSELYPYEDFDGIRLVIDQDYVLQLREGGNWVNVEGIASGGERSIACLALRIAFSHAFIPNLKWLILDEPTHNLDSNSIEKFSEILREKINAFAEQVFLITHEERLSEVGSTIRFERDKARNEATRVVCE